MRYVRGHFKTAPIAMLSVCFALFARSAFAQDEGAKPQRIVREISTRINLRLVVPDKTFDAFRGDWRKFLDAFFTEQPALLTDPLTELFPNLEKPIAYIITDMGLNQPKQYGKTRIYLMNVGLESTDQEYLVITLDVQPAIRAEIPSSSWKEYQDQLKKLSHRIEIGMAKALPEFSKNYLEKQYKDKENRLQMALTKEQDAAAKARADLARDTGLPPEKAAEQLAEISRQQIAAQLALVGMQAREKAIANEIAKAQAKMQEQTESDETVQNLQQLLKMRIEHLDALKKLQSTGVAPTQEVQAAEVDVLSAKIELDKTRSAIKRANGGEQLDALNNELSRLAIDRAETQARSNYLRDLSHQTEQQLHESREVEKLVEAAKPKLAEAEQQIRDHSNQLTALKKAEENIEPLNVIVPDEPADDAQPLKPAKTSPTKNAK